MDDSKLIVALMALTTAMQLAREIVGLIRDLKKGQKSDDNQNGGE